MQIYHYHTGGYGLEVRGSVGRLTPLQNANGFKCIWRMELKKTNLLD